MKIFIDTEFNEFKGDLISMALVAEDGREWYQVLECLNPGAWVAQHVMPILGQASVERLAFQRSLHKFLCDFESIELIADWPDDIKYFCDVLILGPGVRMNTPPLMIEIDPDINSGSAEIPHNALSDARAIKQSYLSGNQAQV